jgi:hypothetical protein
MQRVRWFSHRCAVYSVESVHARTVSERANLPKGPSLREFHFPIWRRPLVAPPDCVGLTRAAAGPPRRVASHDPKTTKEGQHPIQVTECGTLPTADMLDTTSPVRPGLRRLSPEADDEDAGLGKRRLYGHVWLSPNNDQRSARAGYPILEGLPCLSVSGFSITTTHNGGATNLPKVRALGWVRRMSRSRKAGLPRVCRGLDLPHRHAPRHSNGAGTHRVSSRSGYLPRCSRTCYPGCWGCLVVR